MADRDTGMMPGAPGFPSTHWSIVLAARDRTSPLCRESMNRLVKTYWRPVYVYIRAAWSKSNEDAKDLTQEFLVRLAEGPLLEQYQREKGRFRAYLKGALRHFLMDEKKTASRQKRGGGRLHLSLDFKSEDRSIEVASEKGTPEELFDLAWGRSVMQGAFAELRRQLGEQDREITWRVFDRYESPPPEAEETSYRSVGKELGLSPAMVKAHLTYARLHLKKILHDRVAATVAGEDDLFEELRELFD